MERYDIINHLIRKRGYSRYLEIGVLSNAAFYAVKCYHKDGVDPNGQAIYTMTSDEFFEKEMSGRPEKCNYDIIFIDGLHEANQVFRDINNSLKYLNNGGIIVMHDCLPNNEDEQLPNPPGGRPWTGTAWHAFAALRCSRKDLSMCVIDTDYGCGIIERGYQELWPEEVKFTWEYFLKNRNALMNVISTHEFLRRF